MVRRVRKRSWMPSLCMIADDVLLLLFFSILKSMEFSSSGEESQEAKVDAKSLEMLLLEKNRSLQTENTHLKVAKAETTGRSSLPPVYTPILQYRPLIPAPVDRTSASAWLYKPQWIS